MTARGQIVALARANPLATLREIGEAAGVSYQRVQQIVNQEGLLPCRGARPKPLCNVCGTPMSGLHPKTRIHLACRWVELPCLICGKIFKRRLSRLTQMLHPSRSKYRRAFMACSRECWKRRGSGWTRDRPHGGVHK